jgi:uncharacterized coiled-coil protein SlyX
MDDMDIGTTEVTGLVALLGLLSGWLMSGLRGAKKHGQTEERIDVIDGRVSKQETELIELKRLHDADMKDVRAFFQNANGGQKFMSFPDHDIICTRNQRSISQEIQHLTEAVVANTGQVLKMSEQMRQLQVAVAVIQESKNAEHTRRVGDR